jgi:hypothetical protein
MRNIFAFMLVLLWINLFLHFNFQIALVMALELTPSMSGIFSIASAHHPPVFEQDSFQILV